MKLYEALFLIEAGRAAREWDQTEGELLSILEKHGGTVREKARYDERKLAYPVKRARRGAYLLTYFEAPTAAIAEIRGDLSLSEAALRTLILRVDSDQVPEIASLGNTEPRKPEVATEETAAEETATAEAGSNDEESSDENKPVPAEAGGAEDAGESAGSETKEEE